MEETKLSKSWGGAREGAGRKAMDPSEKKAACTFYLDPEHKEKMKAAAKAAGLSLSELLARMIDSL